MSHRILYGGSFDPPHKGHDKVLRAALSQDPDQVLLVPTGQPHYKDPLMFNLDQRLAMCRAWAQMHPRVEVLDWEVTGRLSGLTVDLVDEAACRWPHDRLSFILGSDQFHEFPGWQGADEILARCGLLVVDRPGHEVNHDLLMRLRDAGHEAQIVHTDAEPMSSTEIRAWIAQHNPSWRSWLIEPVAELVQARA